MYKPLTFVFLGTTVAMGALYMSKEAQETPAEPTVTVDDSSKKKLQEMTRQLTDKESRIKELEASISRYQKLSKKKPQPVAVETVASNPNEAVVKMSSREQEFRNTMKKRFAKRTEEQHKILWGKLNLNDEEKSALIDLMNERGMSNMQYHMGLRGASTEEEKEAARLKRDENFQASEEKISELLGDKYDIYADYDDKKKDYQRVSYLNSSLKDSSLNEAQTEQLVTSMNSTNESFEFSNEAVAEDRHAYYSMSDEDKKIYVDELAQRDELVLKESATYLDEDQQEALKKQQASDRARLQRGGSWGRRGRR